MYFFFGISAKMKSKKKEVGLRAFVLFKVLFRESAYYCSSNVYNFSPEWRKYLFAKFNEIALLSFCTLTFLSTTSSAAVQGTLAIMKKALFIHRQLVIPKVILWKIWLVWKWTLLDVIPKMWDENEKQKNLQFQIVSQNLSQPMNSETESVLLSKAGNRRSVFLMGFTSMASENPMGFPVAFLMPLNWNP